MKKQVIIFAALFFLVTMVNGCLISEVNQPSDVNAGATFSTTIIITDSTADTNPHEGLVAILVPDDWTYNSGTYDFAGGTGSMVVDTSSDPVYGDVDTLLPPPSGMKWIRLLSDSDYVNNANEIYEVSMEFQVGQTTGTFPIGYLTTKNASGLFLLNTTDEDNSSAWTDTSMNHMVNVNPATSVEEILSGIPDKFNLAQNYPNPFNPETSIRYSVAKTSNVSLKVYDVTGKEVSVLVNGQRTAGNYEIKFSGNNLSSGIYFYRLETNGFIQTHKMILMK